MTEKDYEELVKQLKLGNNSVLDRLREYQAYCQKTVMIKSFHRCSAEESYDIFIDAVLDFRKNVLADKVEFKAIRAYLARICFNKWMERSRAGQRKQMRSSDETTLEYVPETSPNAEEMQIANEEMRAQQQEDEVRLSWISEGMAGLSEKCQRILRLAIVDELPMATIASVMGLANANVAKATKFRCYQKLVDFISHKDTDRQS